MPHRRVRGTAVIARDEEMLDHAVRPQQVDVIHEKIRIRRDALTDGVGQIEPRRRDSRAACVLVRVEQRHELLHEQCEIECVGRAGA